MFEDAKIEMEMVNYFVKETQMKLFLRMQLVNIQLGNL